MWRQKPSFRFEIDNFSEKEAMISSETFVNGGCEWFLKVYPKGNSRAVNHLSLYLYAVNPKSLQTGWKRSAQYYFVVLNQSDKELYRSHSKYEQASSLFNAESPSWGFPNTLPLSKVHEKGVLENDKLIIEFYINVTEAVDGEGEEDMSKKNETVEINGFHVSASQVTSVKKLFAEHPDISEDIKLKNKAVKTTYMNVLLKLIKKLEKPPNSLSLTKLNKASSKLSELMDVGFKLGWLKSKLDEHIKNLEFIELESLKSKLEELSLKMKKTEDDDVSQVKQLEERFMKLESMMKKTEDADSSRVQQLEERLKSLELMENGLKIQCLSTKLNEVFLDRKKYDAYGSCVQKLEERLKNLEEACLERNNSKDADSSRVEQLEVRFTALEFRYGTTCKYLKSKFENDSLERKKTHDADVSRIQKLEDYLEDNVENLELMVSALKDELGKKKDKSSADGFMLVD